MLCRFLDSHQIFINQYSQALSVLNTCQCHVHHTCRLWMHTLRRWTSCIPRSDRPCPFLTFVTIWFLQGCLFFNMGRRLSCSWTGKLFFGIQLRRVGMLFNTFIVLLLPGVLRTLRRKAGGVLWVLVMCQVQRRFRLLTKTCGLVPTIFTYTFIQSFAEWLFLLQCSSPRCSAAASNISAWAMAAAASFPDAGHLN